MSEVEKVEGSIKDCHDNLVAFQKLIGETANRHQQNYMKACAEVALAQEQIEGLIKTLEQKKEEKKLLEGALNTVNQVLGVDSFRKVVEIVGKLKDVPVPAAPATQEQLLDKIQKEAKR